MPAASPAVSYNRLGPSPVNSIATSALIYNQPYNAGRQPPVNATSAPSITIGLTWSSTGANALESGLPGLLAFMVDIINGRGGVWMNGVQHSVNVLLGDDQSSVSYMQLMYEDMLSQGVQVFVAPFGDDYISPLLPLIRSSNATFYNVEPSDPSIFANNTGGNLWAFAPTADLYLRTSLDLIDSATQLLYNQTVNKQVKTRGYVSPYGLTTVCAYTANVTLFKVQRIGLLNWISSANAARRTAGAQTQDMVQLLVDETVPDLGVDGSVYQPYYDNCPDNVDALVLLVDGMGAIEGMASSELRSKAVVGLVGNDGFDSHLQSDVTAAAGLMQPIPVDVPYVTDIPGGPFANYGEMIELFEIYTAIAYGSPTVPTTALLGYAANVAELMSAINLSRSLSPVDTRAGTLALNGYISMCGLITFNASTGVNVARIGQISQMLPTGSSQIVTSEAELIFPYPWPWHRVVAGDSIEHSQLSIWIILGLVIGVLGTWVAQIIMEQAIFSRRRGGLYHAWLAIVTLSLGGVGVWCNMLVQSTALTTALPGASSNLPISWSLAAMLLALLSCLLLIFVGLLTAIGDVDQTSINTERGGRASEIGRALRAEKMAKTKAAALSNRQHLTYLVDCITWRGSFGGLLTVASVVLTRVPLWSIWVQDADYASVAWGWVLTLLIDIVLIPTALLMFIHALRWRILAVFVFSAAVMADWQIMVVSMRFTYAPSRTSFLNSVTISSEVIVLVAGLIAAAIAFAFIGLLFSAMRLSRNDLSLIVFELETAVSRLKGKMAEDANRMQLYVKRVDVLARSLEAVNVQSSLPQDYGLALAMYTSVSVLSAGERVKSGSAVTSVLPPSPITSRIKSLSMKQSASDLITEQQVIPDRSPVVTAPRTTEHGLLNGHPSSSAVAPAPFGPLRAESSKHSGTQPDKCSSHTHVSQVAIVTPADRKLETKLEDTLTALARFQMEDSVSSDGACDPALVANPTFVGRGRMTASGSKSTLITGRAMSGRPSPKESGLNVPLLVGEESEIQAVPPAPSMETVIEHPVAVEVFKEELRKSQSVESLVFCLHVRHYRVLQSKKARRLLAIFVADAFIRTSSLQQININSRQRDSILAVVDKKDAACSATLFDEAERECMTLMRTNVFKGFTTSRSYRLCAWLCHSLDVKGTTCSRLGNASGADSDNVVTDSPWVNTRASQSSSVLSSI